jgi:hypothetical protein
LDAGDGICEDTGHSNDPVHGCDGWDGHGMVLEKKGVGELFPISALHYCLYTSIVLQGRANVPAVGGMEAPGFGSRWFEMDEDLGARWSHEGSIKRKKSLFMDSKAESAGF